jgi:hypothetical protein
VSNEVYGYTAKQLANFSCTCATQQMVPKTVLTLSHQMLTYSTVLYVYPYSMVRKLLGTTFHIFPVFIILCEFQVRSSVLRSSFFWDVTCVYWYLPTFRNNLSGLIFKGQRSVFIPACFTLEDGTDKF